MESTNIMDNRLKWQLSWTIKAYLVLSATKIIKTTQHKFPHLHCPCTTVGKTIKMIKIVTCYLIGSTEKQTSHWESGELGFYCLSTKLKPLHQLTNKCLGNSEYIIYVNNICDVYFGVTICYSSWLWIDEIHLNFLQMHDIADSSH